MNSSTKVTMLYIKSTNLAIIRKLRKDVEISMAKKLSISHQARGYCLILK